MRQMRALCAAVTFVAGTLAASEASEASADDSESALEAGAPALDDGPASESLDETDKSPAE